MFGYSRQPGPAHEAPGGARTGERDRPLRQQVGQRVVAPERGGHADDVRTADDRLDIPSRDGPAKPSARIDFPPRRPALDPRAGQEPAGALRQTLPANRRPSEMQSSGIATSRTVHAADTTAGWVPANAGFRTLNQFQKNSIATATSP